MYQRFEKDSKIVGGRLLIGVKDNGRIAGIKSDEEFYMVESAAKIYSKPAITFFRVLLIITSHQDCQGFS